jgi:hypothetical protein
MNLYLDAMEPCQMIHEITDNDTYGGEITQYVRGAKFEASITFDTSVQARIGLSQGVRNMYTIHTRKSKMLKPFDLFERQSDGKTFRVTSDGKDAKTPPTASIDMRVCTAEEYAITGEVSTL